MSLQDAIDRTLRRAEEIPGVVAVLLTGSAARDELMPHSDYDFLVLIDDDVPWPLPFRDGGREAYIGEDGRQVEIGFSTLRRVREKIAETTVQGVPFRAEALVEGRVLVRHGDAFDGLVEEARSILASGPTIERQDLLWECYDIWNQMKDLLDVASDEATAALIAPPLFEHLLRFYFRLDGRWLPRPKAMMKTLAEADAAYPALALAYVGAASTTERISALQAMMADLAGRFELVFETGHTSAR